MITAKVCLILVNLGLYYYNAASVIIVREDDKSLLLDHNVSSFFFGHCDKDPQPTCNGTDHECTCTNSAYTCTSPASSSSMTTTLGSESESSSSSAAAPPTPCAKFGEAACFTTMDLHPKCINYLTCTPCSTSADCRSSQYACVHVGNASNCDVHYFYQVCPHHYDSVCASLIQ